MVTGFCFQTRSFPWLSWSTAGFRTSSTQSFKSLFFPVCFCFGSVSTTAFGRFEVHAASIDRIVWLLSLADESNVLFILHSEDHCCFPTVAHVCHSVVMATVSRDAWPNVRLQARRWSLHGVNILISTHGFSRVHSSCNRMWMFSGTQDIFLRRWWILHLVLDLSCGASVRWAAFHAVLR